MSRDLGEIIGVTFWIGIGILALVFLACIGLWLMGLKEIGH